MSREFRACRRRRSPALDQRDREEAEAMTVVEAASNAIFPGVRSLQVVAVRRSRFSLRPFHRPHSLYPRGEFRLR